MDRAGWWRSCCDVVLEILVETSPKSLDTGCWTHCRAPILEVRPASTVSSVAWHIIIAMCNYPNKYSTHLKTQYKNNNDVWHYTSSTLLSTSRRPLPSNAPHHHNRHYHRLPPVPRHLYTQSPNQHKRHRIPNSPWNYPTIISQSYLNCDEKPWLSSFLYSLSWRNWFWLTSAIHRVVYVLLRRGKLKRFSRMKHPCLDKGMCYTVPMIFVHESGHGGKGRRSWGCLL